MMTKRPRLQQLLPKQLQLLLLLLPLPRPQPLRHLMLLPLPLLPLPRPHLLLMPFPLPHRSQKMEQLLLLLPLPRPQPLPLSLLPLPQPHLLLLPLLDLLPAWLRLTPKPLPNLCQKSEQRNQKVPAPRSLLIRMRTRRQSQVSMKMKTAIPMMVNTVRLE